MADKKRQDLNSHAVPFFARYLEGQLEELSDEEAEAVDGGNSFTETRKFPSDHEDGVGGGDTMTLKFPSDAEDGGGGDPFPMTLKFPSDGDDAPPNI